MKKPIPYFKIFGKDFLAMTYGLSNAELGKMMRLLCRKSIGFDIEKEKKKLKNYNIFEIFEESVEKDLNFYNNICLKNQRASNARWNSDASATHTQPEPEPEPERIKKDLLVDFDDFWSKFIPYKTRDGRFTGKGHKKPAQQSYLKTIKKGVTHEEIIKKLNEYLKYKQKIDQPTQHATSWLNQEGYNTDYNGEEYIIAEAKNTNRKQSKYDRTAENAREVYREMSEESIQADNKAVLSGFRN